MTKIIAVGIDGASPVLIHRWIEELPTFRKIKLDGFLTSSVPPTPAQTPVAWTTFMTGKNPGKHGIFSFMMRQKGTYERRIVEPAMIESKVLWQLLAERDKKVGVVNVPMSDPRQFHGFIIPGFLSPTEGIPYPQHMKNLVRREFGSETLKGDVETAFLQKIEREPIKFFKRVNQITDQTAQVSHFLTRNENWDFFMTVFMGTDRIQHFFWKYVDPSHEEFENNAFSALVKEYYLKLDEILKRFLSSIDKETLMIVLSDHGFCSVNKELYINNHLEELGFLETKDGRIDFKRSQAVSYGYGDIWLNVKGREPNGLLRSGEEYTKTRNSIIHELGKTRIDGKLPFKGIKKREDIYWGDCLASAPDLMVIFNKGWQGARQPEIIVKQSSHPYSNESPRWNGGHDGTHDPEDVPGILGLIGGGVEFSENQKVKLWDLAPTILNLLHIPVPRDIDGRSLSN